MLTPSEQEQILAQARRVASLEKQLATRVRRGLMSEKSAAQSRQRAWDELRDFLKEVG